MCDVPLKIPLGALALGGCGQGNYAAHTWAEVLGDALYHASFTGCIAAFEDNDDLEARVLYSGL